MRKTHVEPVPPAGGHEFVLDYLRRAISTPGVQEIHVTSAGILVVGEVQGQDDEVVPEGTDEVDVPFLLERLELVTHPYTAGEHGTASLFHASQRIVSAGLAPYWVLVPGLKIAAAWLGVRGAADISTIYGIKPRVEDMRTLNGRVILLGSPKNHLSISDATLGVCIDLGVA
jgi:hypothetical protein